MAASKGRERWRRPTNWVPLRSRSPFHVKNLHATILHQMGLDPNELSYFYGGLDQKLVGVEHVNQSKSVSHDYSPKTNMVPD